VNRTFRTFRATLTATFSVSERFFDAVEPREARRLAYAELYRILADKVERGDYSVEEGKEN